MGRIVKRTLSFNLPLIALTQTLSACPRCRAQAAAVIYNRDFGIHFIFVLLPILILMAIGFGLYYVDGLISEWERR